MKEYNTIEISQKWSKKDFYYKTGEEYWDQNAIFDGDIPLTLWKEENFIAVSCISRGLHKYFDSIMDHTQDCYIKHKCVSPNAFDDHNKAAEFAKDLYGIVQMQAMPETQHIRGGIAYHDILMEGLSKLMKRNDFIVEFFLPAKLNMYIMPQMIYESGMTDEKVDKFLRNLEKNYDKVAYRHAYNYDVKSCLYLKNSKK